MPINARKLHRLPPETAASPLRKMRYEPYRDLIVRERQRLYLANSENNPTFPLKETVWQSRCNVDASWRAAIGESHSLDRVRSLAIRGKKKSDQRWIGKNREQAREDDLANPTGTIRHDRQSVVWLVEPAWKAIVTLLWVAPGDRLSLSLSLSGRGSPIAEPLAGRRETRRARGKSEERDTREGRQEEGRRGL